MLRPKALILPLTPFSHKPHPAHGNILFAVTLGDSQSPAIVLSPGAYLQGFFLSLSHGHLSPDRCSGFLVHRGFQRKTPQAGCLLSNKHPFLMVPATGSPRSGCQHGWVRALFRVTGSLLCPHMAEGARELLGLFTGAFISFLRDFLVLWWFKNLPANVGALGLSLARELGSPMQWDS